MTSRNREAVLKDVGERGFLKKFLPRLSRFSPAKFLVPPGDDAAVLKTSSRPSLSIDGLTEGTHFRSSWAPLFEKTTGVAFGRALGWKLLGSALSDLAAMGGAKNKWAMIYLGAPGSTKIKFLQDFYEGLTETARRYDCALAGGDTVRAAQLSMVAAVGGELEGKKPVTRTGAKPGDVICVGAHVGDASFGLQLLEKKIKVPRTSAAYFMRRFFEVIPQFYEVNRLREVGGVTSMLDLSDSLGESVQILCDASKVGAVVDISMIPISTPYGWLCQRTPALLTGGEDYSLLFTVPASIYAKLSDRSGPSFEAIGVIRPRSYGIKYFNGRKRIPTPRFFQHYGAT